MMTSRQRVYSLEFSGRLFCFLVEHLWGYVGIQWPIPISGLHGEGGWEGARCKKGLGEAPLRSSGGRKRRGIAR